MLVPAMQVSAFGVCLLLTKGLGHGRARLQFQPLPQQHLALFSIRSNDCAFVGWFWCWYMAWTGRFVSGLVDQANPRQTAVIRARQHAARCGQAARADGE